MRPRVLQFQKYVVLPFIRCIHTSGFLACATIPQTKSNEPNGTPLHTGSISLSITPSDVFLRVAHDKASEPLRRVREAAAKLSTGEIVDLFRQLQFPKGFDVDGRNLAFSVLVDQAVDMLLRFSVAEVLDMISCFPSDNNSVGSAEFGFMATLLEFLNGSMADFSPSDLGKVFFGIHATAQSAGTTWTLPIVKKLSALALPKSASFGALDLFRAMSCLHSFGREEVDLIVSLCDRARHVLPAFNGAQLADLVDWLAAMRLYHVAVPMMITEAMSYMRSEKVTREVMAAQKAEKPHEFSQACLLPKHMVKLLCAMGSFNHFNTIDAKRLCTALLRFTPSLQIREAIKLLAALAEMQEHEVKRVEMCGQNVEQIGEDYEKTLVLQVWDRVRCAHPATLTPALLDRVFRMRTALLLEHPDWKLPISRGWEDAIKLKPHCYEGDQFSPLHKEVCRVLSGMNVEYENEHHIGILKVDIALVRERICIEVHGPVHFDRRFWVHTGRSQLKRRMITNLGWQLIDVVYREWTQHRHAREQYLRRLLGPLLPMHGLLENS